MKNNRTDEFGTGTMASFSSAPPRVARLVENYRIMRLGRWVDELEMELVRQGAAFFQVSCTGHEGIAVLAHCLIPEDWLHLHYRDKALVLARGVKPVAFFDGLLCNVGLLSAGRQMSAHLCDPALHILSMVGPVGNNALQAVGIASMLRNDPAGVIVVCCVGDGTTQEGEFLEAIGEAVRSQLPILFVVEHNGFAISTRTEARTFYSLPAVYPEPETFFGVPIHHLDGTKPYECDQPLEGIVANIRTTGQPALVIFHVERLSSHTNADDQTLYRSEEEIRRAYERGDPVENLRFHLASIGFFEEELRSFDEETEAGGTSGRPPSQPKGAALTRDRGQDQAPRPCLMWSVRIPWYSL